MISIAKKSRSQQGSLHKRPAQGTQWITCREAKRVATESLLFAFSIQKANKTLTHVNLLARYAKVLEGQLATTGAEHEIRSSRFQMALGKISENSVRAAAGLPVQ